MPTFFNSDENLLDREIVIVVEGKDDANFFDVLLTSLSADPNRVSVVIAQGKSKIRSTINSLLKSSSFADGTIRRYAIVRDADSPFQTAQTEVGDMMEQLGEPRVTSGNISEREDGRFVGFFLIPNSNDDGDMEALCMRSVGGTASATLAEQYIADAETESGAFNQRNKRLAQAYLAISSGDLCNGVGYATTRGKFGVGHAAFQPLTTFIQELLMP